MSSDVRPAPQRRSERARSVLTILAAYAGGLVLLYEILRSGPIGPWRTVDLIGGAVACSALYARRRAPILVGLLLAVAAVVFASAGVANMIALYFVARLRPLRAAILVGLADVVAGWLFWLLYPGNSRLSLTLVVNAAIAAAVVAWGALLQSQDALLAAYRERAERAEQDKLRREEQIRAGERTRIAREMHDVIAHRISLVALHAGGLEVAPAQGTSQVEATAALIRSCAIDALDELRATIGVLRQDGTPSLQQPGLNRLGDLVADARDAGQRVEVSIDADIDTAAPIGVGRDVYRIVQEGLTNARKHAPDEPVRVRIGLVDKDVEIRVVNRCRDVAKTLPGSGSGLLGLAERVELVGGTIRHSETADGEFELYARLPWHR